jgi:hypothetical protein
MLRAALFTAATLLLVVTTTAAEDDPILAGLKKAKGEYLADMGKATTEMVNRWLAREEAARKEGNKAKLDAVKAERKAFEEKGEYPPGPDSAWRLREAAYRKMEAAYKTAIAKYTKVGNDESAAAVEKEFEKFWKTNLFPPGRYAVNYTGKVGATTELREDGTFTRIRKGLEPRSGNYTYDDGKLIQKSETYVELWTWKDGVIHLELYYPAATYPRGKVDTVGTVKLVKRAEKKK